jgi:hypothetical protein
MQADARARMTRAGAVPLGLATVLPNAMIAGYVLVP